MDLELTRIFVKVVQHGSFSKAADLLKLPKSTISKAVTRLESETSTKLLMRTTRSLSLTAAGRVFYDSCLGPIQVLEDARRSLEGGDGVLSGLVRITAPEDLGSHVIAPVIAALTVKHPALVFELLYTDEVIDLVKDGFDIAVRIGRLTESRFKAKRAGEVTLVLVASPKYLRSRPKITKPQDLENHDCLTFSDQAYRRWALRSAKESANVAINARISSNQMTSLLKMALSHAGIALVPRYLCEADIISGGLVQVLPSWSSTGLPVSVISPLASSSVVRLKLTVDHLVSSLNEIL